MRTFVAQVAQVAQVARRGGMTRREGARCGRVRRVPAGLRTPIEKGAAGNPDGSWWFDMVLEGERLPG